MIDQAHGPVQSSAPLGGADRPALQHNPEMACEEGFEPPTDGLEMPRPFLTGSHICLRLALALAIILGLTGRLDAQSANLLWKVILP